HFEPSAIIRWREQVVAAWALGHAPWDRAEAWSVADMLGLVLERRPDRHVGCLVAGVHPIGWTYLAYTYFKDSRANRVRAAVARALGRLRVPISVNALAEASIEKGRLHQASGDNKVRQAAWEALLDVLPTLTPDHYGKLRAQTVPNLCRLLQTNYQ